MLIIESSSLDPYRNLAVEEYLMEHHTDQGPALFLWRSDCAVVMGKNQNPWRECRLGLMRDEGIPLARRISGGGTVYHDKGNLNYCVITDRVKYQEDRAYKMVLQALEMLGIYAKKTGASNLSLDGLKFSGNAFCFRKGRALHHGTLLLNTHLARLARYLGPSLNSIETHAIRSVPAAVTNLGLDIDSISAALTDRFQALYGEGQSPTKLPDTALLPSLLETYQERQNSNRWKYGATPRFSVKTPTLQLEIEKGIVVTAQGTSAKQFLNTCFSKSSFSLPCDVD